MFYMQVFYFPLNLACGARGVGKRFCVVVPFALPGLMYLASRRTLRFSRLVLFSSRRAGPAAIRAAASPHDERATTFDQRKQSKSFPTFLNGPMIQHFFLQNQQCGEIKVVNLDECL